MPSCPHAASSAPRCQRSLRPSRRVVHGSADNCRTGGGACCSSLRHGHAMQCLQPESRGRVRNATMIMWGGGRSLCSGPAVGLLVGRPTARAARILSSGFVWAGKQQDLTVLAGESATNESQEAWAVGEVQGGNWARLAANAWVCVTVRKERKRERQTDKLGKIHKDS